MKSRTKIAARRRPSRRVAPLSLSMRIERLEKVVLWPTPSGAPAPPPGQRFTKLDASGKPTTGTHTAVHDAKTGLTWSAEPLQSDKELYHADALKACSSLELLGKKDWRAPTIEELLSIVDYTRCDPAVDSDYFLGPYGWTWSSTVAKAPAGYAWHVDLYDGSSLRVGQTDHLHVRAVRSGQQLPIGI